MDTPYIASDNTSNLPKVHAATSRSQSISFIQNIFQPVPKLYKYSADQLQVVVHRRSGEVEHISRTEKHVSNGVQGIGRQKVKCTSKESSGTSESLQSGTKTDEDLSSLANSNQVGGYDNVSTYSSTRKESSGPDHYSSDQLPQPIEETSPSKASTSSECSSCEALLCLVGDADVQVSRLREQLDTKDIQLQEFEKRFRELMKENNILKTYVVGMKKGITGLTKIVKSSNTNAELKDKKITELLQRAWPQDPVLNSHTFLKDMELNLEKMRDHVSRLSTVPYFGSKSPSPILVTTKNDT